MVNKDYQYWMWLSFSSLQADSAQLVVVKIQALRHCPVLPCPILQFQRCPPAAARPLVDCRRCLRCAGSSIPTLCLKKTCTLQAGRHKFIKISSPVMIFHTRHRHSVADRLRSKSLVRVEYQLQGFHGNKTTNNRMLFITEHIRRRRRLI